MTPANLEELKRAAVAFDANRSNWQAWDAFTNAATCDTILSLISELEAERERRESAEAALKEARKPDTYWSYEDPECGWDSFEEPLSEAGYGNEVVRLLTGKTLGEVWAANRVLTVDQNGDPDETEAVCFDNQHDAARCYPDSLATARAHFQSQEASDGE